jgi:hypothetical protein
MTFIEKRSYRGKRSDKLAEKRMWGWRGIEGAV